MAAICIQMDANFFDADFFNNFYFRISQNLELLSEMTSAFIYDYFIIVFLIKKINEND